MLITTENLRTICCKGGQTISTNLNIRADKAIKTQMEAIFDELGLSMTTTMNLFLRTTAGENKTPFRLQLDRPNITIAAAIAGGRAMLGSPDTPKYSSMGALRVALEV